MTTEIITDKFDVLRGRLLGNHNDFHWQLGGQINHQPCGSRYDFPGVDHEGRQTCRLKLLLVNVARENAKRN